MPRIIFFNAPMAAIGQNGAKFSRNRGRNQSKLPGQTIGADQAHPDRNHTNLGDPGHSSPTSGQLQSTPPEVRRILRAEIGPDSAEIAGEVFPMSAPAAAEIGPTRPQIRLSPAQVRPKSAAEIGQCLADIGQATWALPRAKLSRISSKLQTKEYANEMFYMNMSTQFTSVDQFWSKSGHWQVG